MPHVQNTLMLFRLTKLPNPIESNFSFRYDRLCDFLEKMAKLFANSGKPDQTLHSAACDLGLHCLPITLFGVSRLK